MKKVLLGLVLVLGTLVSKGQDEEIVPDLKPYEDISSKLFISKVIEISGKNQKDISIQFKNWASTAFVNLKEVMVSETENQIVLNYIIETYSYAKSLGMKIPFKQNLYVRLVAQFKDGKIRIQFYDDGNAVSPSMYSSVPPTPVRSFYISTFQQKPDSYKEMHKAGIGQYYDFHYQWQQKVSTMVLSCEKGILDNALTIKKDDF